MKPSVSSSIYCNPLPLPDYPRGRYCGPLLEPEKSLPHLAEFFSGLFLGPKRDFRESGDVDLMYSQGTWYLYGSSRDGRSVWSSTDFVNWTSHHLEIDGPDGYAPTAVERNGKFYLSYSLCPLYESDSPLGPFHSLGMIQDMDGQPLRAYLDPDLFVDDDGRFYVYYGYGPCDGGLFGAEIELGEPPRVKAAPTFLFDFVPEHVWERFGENYEHSDLASVEGASMFKHNGTYYFLYSANGAVFRHYAEGCYHSNSPLGPFVYGDESPIARQPNGIVNAPGHGACVQGPGDSVWYFYSSCIRRVHNFERRIGMDKIEFDAEGKMHLTVSQVPMGIDGTSAGWDSVSENKPTSASSYAFRNYPTYAVDNCTHTWWQPGEDEEEPWLEVKLRREFVIHAIRILWTEDNLAYEEGIVPEPVRFKVQFMDEQRQVLNELDCSDNSTDRIVEFLTFEPQRAERVRLIILQKGDKVLHGVTDFTCYGVMA